MANLSDLIAQSTSDNPQKLVNLALATQMMGSGSGGSGSGLGGTNYIFVKGDGTPEENAIELQEAYDTAKTMPIYRGLLSGINTFYIDQTFESSENNLFYRVISNYTGEVSEVIDFAVQVTEEEAKSVHTTVVVAPGQYKFGETAFIVDTPYINIVSLTGNSDVILNSDENKSGREVGINVTANNVYLKGLDCGANSFTVGNYLNTLVCENCIGGDYSFGGAGTASGTFSYCTGGNNSFGGYGTASGTFDYCTGGDYSFGGDEGTTSGTFTNCSGGNNSFGGDGGTASGTFTNCSGGNNSFGGGGAIASTARLYYCRLNSGTFGTPEAGGKLVLCIDGNDAVVTTS